MFPPRLLLVGLAALAPALTAQSPPDLGPTVLLPGDAAIDLAGGIQQFPAVAAGNGVTLAVWQDHRAVPSTLFTSEGTRGVWARRLAADGTPFDPLPFRVSDVPGRKSDVCVAFDGTNWLVTWENEIPTTFFKAAALLGVRVATDGTVLDEEPITIRAYPFSKVTTSVLAGDAFGWVALVQGVQVGESSLEAHRITSDGTVIPGGSGSLLSSTTLYTYLDLSSSADGLLLAASAGGVVKVRRLSSALVPLGGELVLAGGNCENPSIASDGADFLVAWENSSFGYRIQARRVSSTGALGATTEITPIGLENCYDPSVVWSGSEYLLAFSASTFVFPQGLTQRLRVASVAADGTPMDVPGAALEQGALPRDPDLASLGDGTAQIVWRDEQTAPPHKGDVFGTRLTPSGFGPPVALSVSTSRHADPDLVAGGEGYLAVFASERDGAVEILAQRLDRFGAALDAEPIELASGPALGLPRAAWNGSSFLVVWQDEVELDHTQGGGVPTDDVVLGRRLAADGTLLDPAPFHVLDGATPDLEAVGELFLVAARRADTTEIFRIYGVRVDGQGGVVDAEPLLLGGNFARFPSVGAFDDRWIVAWQRNPSHDDPGQSIFARIVLADGKTLPQVFVDGGPRPDVAASDDVALVTRAGSRIRATLIADDGSLLGATFEVGGPEGQIEPSVAWDGSEFVVAWEDARHATSLVDERRDVFAARISESGELLDAPGGFPVAVSAEDERTPVVAAREGDTLFGFGLLVPEPPHATRRVALVRASDWTSVAGGVAGLAGLPVLAGAGALEGGSVLALGLSGAAPSAPVAIVFGIASLELPFLGGVLVPAPAQLLPLATDAHGRTGMSLSLSPTLPSGLQLWVQCWVLDAAAPFGFAGSNGLTQAAQ